jgi:mono/diheme cytochrome c family protein
MKIFLFVACAAFLVQACNQTSSRKLSDEEILRNGARLYTRYICNTCHSLEGEEIYGPPLDRLYLSKVEVIRNGKQVTVTADRAYLKKAILDPRFEEVAGYQSKEMPEVHISEKEVELLVEYLVLMGQTDSSGYR